MNEYLYRVTIEFPYFWKGSKDPVYAVATSKEAVTEYVTKHLNCGKVKKVSVLGMRLGMNLYRGKKGG